MPPFAGWLKTGRKASEDHWDTLEVDRWVEFVALDDAGKQQGRVLAYLVAEGESGRMKAGKILVAHVLGCEDEYYEHWPDGTYGVYRLDRRCPLHFCATHASRCREATVYRDIIHVDVFRVLEHEALDKLAWLRDEVRGRMVAYPAYVAHVTAAPGASGPGGSGIQGDGGQGVVPGIPGIEGLAGALGAGVGNLDVPEDPGPSRRRRRKGETVEDAETDGGHSPEDLAGEIARRKPQAPMASALELSGDPDDKKKKKKKKKKEEPETSDSSYSSEDSVFRLAALPRGVERLRRIHQRKPGKLASLTLLRLQELLLRAQGGGPAQQSSRVPGVARAYLHQIYFAQHGVDQLGPRNSRSGTVAGQLESGGGTGAGHDPRPNSGIQARVEGRPARGQSRSGAPEGSIAPELEASEVVRGRRRRRDGEGGHGQAAGERSKGSPQRKRQGQARQGEVASLKLDEVDSFPGESALVVDGVLRLPELESAFNFPGIYADDPSPDLQVLLGLCKIPELGELLKFGLRQLSSESSRDRLRHNFACFMVDHSDLTAGRSSFWLRPRSSLLSFIRHGALWNRWPLLPIWEQGVASLGGCMDVDLRRTVRRCLSS